MSTPVDFTVRLSEEERRAVLEAFASARRAVFFRRRVRESYTFPLPKESEDILRRDDNREFDRLEMLRKKFERAEGTA